MVETERLRVLVAEDETIIRLDICALLTANGFEVCAVARDGLEAVERARETAPSLVLLDVKMPRLDGIEAARRITAERSVPIVMLTSYSDRATVSRAIDAGIGGYLVKPFKEVDLVTTLRTAAARHADLVEARRSAEPGPRRLDLEVHSRTGRSWPVHLGVKDGEPLWPRDGG